MCFSPSVHLKISVCFHQTGFHSVVIITFASHAKGPQFKTGREQLLSFSQLFNLLSVEEELNTTKALRPRGMKTVAKGVADAKMKVQSLFAPKLNHTRAVPSLRGFSSVEHERRFLSEWPSVEQQLYATKVFLYTGVKTIIKPH